MHGVAVIGLLATNNQSINQSNHYIFCQYQSLVGRKTEAFCSGYNAPNLLFFEMYKGGR
jgi:hypothetical protein